MVLLRAAVKFFEFFGGFNHIQNSSWSVLVYLKDTKNGDTGSIEGIGSGGPLRVGGEYFDE